MSTYTVRRFLRRGGLALAAFTLAAALVYRGRLAPVPVAGHRVAPGPVAAEVLGTGTLEARVSTTVSTEVAGRLIALAADQNDVVQAGRQLARLDDAEWQRQVEIARAALNAARATVDRVQADVRRAEAVLQQAQVDFDRTRSLVASGQLSEAELDKARERLRVAEAEAARATSATVEAQRQVTTAEQTLEYREAQLARTRILSPLTGLVVRRVRAVGDVVVPGAAIFELIATDALWVSAWVDESAMARLERGQPARIVFRSEPTREYPGRVERLGREVDRETREFLVDVLVAELPATWAVGQRAEVYIETARRDARTRIPLRLLSWRRDNPGVLVDAGGRAEWRAVDLGLQGLHMTEVVAGLEPGEVVLERPDDRQALQLDGRRIRVTS